MELTFSYSDVFYTQNLSLTFSQPSINLFMFFIDRYNLTVIGQHYHFMTASDRFPVPVRSAVKSE